MALTTPTFPSGTTAADLLFNAVEAAKAGEPGADKKSSVVDLAKAKLKPKEIKLLNRRFGSIDTAVQAAFEMSSTAKKKRSD